MFSGVIPLALDGAQRFGTKQQKIQPVIRKSVQSVMSELRIQQLTRRTGEYAMQHLSRAQEVAFPLGSTRIALIR